MYVYCLFIKTEADNQNLNGINSAESSRVHRIKQQIKQKLKFERGCEKEANKELNKR